MTALRIGILLGDNLVEERTFVDGPVTLGQSLRSQLSVPVEGVPFDHALFVREGGRWMIRMPAGPVVAAEARGKLVIGEATILYQEVAAPIATPRPQLPAALRGTLADRVDKRLAVIVGGSLLVHIGIAAWAWATEVEQPLILERAAVATYRHDTYSIELPDVADEIAAAPSTAVPTAPGAATPIAPAQTPAPIVPKPGIPRPPVQMSTSDAERFAQYLTSDRAQPGGRTEMAGRTPGAELGKQIADIRENGRAIGNDQGGFRNRDREGLGDGHEITRDEPRGLETQGPRTERPPGRITLKPTPKPAGDGPNPDAVIARIRDQYMRGLMRCYEVGLRTDASLRGTVAVAFTVAESGKLTDASAHGVSPDVDACIATQMTSWRFGVPRDAQGTPTELDIKLSLALVPAT